MAEALRLVMVEWEDSHGGQGWEDLSGDLQDRALVCRSVGWLMLEGAVATVLVPHVNQEETGVPLQGCGVMTIPTRAVLRVVPLVEAHPQGS